MVVYFDKTNLESYIGSHSDERFSSTFKTIRNHLNVQFNFSKEEIRTSGRSEAMMKFLSQLMQGRGTLNIKFEPEIFPERPVKSNLHSRISHKPRAVMLLDDEELVACKEVGACMVGGVGEEVETLNSFFLGNDGDGYEKSFVVGAKNPSVQLRSWDDLRNYTLPFSDLIITDRHILKIDEHSFRNNFGKFLEAMHAGKSVKTNIVLFTLLENNRSDLSYKFIRDVVTDVTKRITGKAANFTLIWSNNKDIVKHDRYIITNYQLIKSGATIMYFGEDGKVLPGADKSSLDISTLANSNKRDSAEEFLQYMQEGIDKLQRNNPDMIQGDKKSNFLNFNI